VSCQYEYLRTLIYVEGGFYGEGRDQGGWVGGGAGDIEPDDYMIVDTLMNNVGVKRHRVLM